MYHVIIPETFGNRAIPVSDEAIRYYELDETIVKTYTTLGINPCNDNRVMLISDIDEDDDHLVMYLPYAAFEWICHRRTEDSMDIAQAIAQSLRTEFGEDRVDLIAKPAA